jgi:cell filamentation protein, protein adenylyltransferase
MANVESIPYTPAYRRYTPAAAESLMRIAAALGRIDGARVLPAVADQLRASARVGSVHFSNLIEGNDLPVIEAERATRGQLAPDTRAKIELVNYVAALDLIDRRLDEGSLELNPSFLLDLHATTMRGLGRDDARFKPHHEGEWRDGHAVIFDHFTQQVMHEGPPSDEVEPRTIGMFEWLNGKLDAGDPPFVIAGVAHYAITDIHPFADGNGRVARLFQTAVLIRAGVLPGRMFSFERYYADDRPAYYAALRSVRERTFNMEVWIEYFLRGLVEEYERVAATITELSELMPGGGRAPLQLSASQQRAVTGLRLQGRREFSRRDYEEAAAVSRSAANEDLQMLAIHGVVEVLGAGPRTRYAFSGAVEARRSMGAGRPTKWTDTLIEVELRAFLSDRSEWPSPEEFRAAGRGPLYAAASRAGGIKRWRQNVGF